MLNSENGALRAVAVVLVVTGIMYLLSDAFDKPKRARDITPAPVPPDPPPAPPAKAEYSPSVDPAAPPADPAAPAPA